MNDFDEINNLLSELDLGDSEKMLIFVESFINKVEVEIDNLITTGEEKSIYDTGKMMGKLEERLMISKEGIEKSEKYGVDLLGKEKW